ncbi:MAG: AmmeMemoRadiSam system protein B [Nanoarchaeota archaeon]|nr:AmmeMemoRadiSam system protein B [Nanoarchaeota archaeon]
MRQPIANKSHYANGITLLDKQFDDLFHHEKGPGALPASKLENNTDLKGIIVPHAPLPLCGPCASWAYKALAEMPEKPDVYFLIGQAQHSTGAGATMETHQTPYGEARVDQTLLRAIVEKGHLALNDKLHQEESVIEVQLPFLQFINKSRMEGIKIIPLLLNTDSEINELAVDIKETLLEQNKKAAFIFITNFTSYGRDFKYVPFTDNIQEQIVDLDKKLFGALTTNDKDTFFEIVKENVIPISGYAALQMYFKLFGDRPIELEQYYLSGDLNNTYTASVSYAALVIR